MVIHKMFKILQVCVNDDLVAKNFAYYVSPMGNKNLNPLEKPRQSLNSVTCSSKLSPSLTLWPMLLQGKDYHRMESEYRVPHP
jgi:ATP-dependent RNA helicase TDRD12